MAQPGDTYPLDILVTDADGDPVTGLAEGDFSLTAYHNGSIFAVSLSDFSELGSGYYHLEFALPGSRGTFRCDISAGADRYCDPDVLGPGEIENNDRDSLVGAIRLQPVLAVGQNAAATRDFTIELYVHDYREVTIPVYDAAGDALDLTGYDNLVFSVQNEGQTTVSGALPYNQSTGITNNEDEGTVTVAIPEDASFYDAADEGPSGQGARAATLYWSLKGDEDGDSSKTRTLRSGTIVLKRKETE